MLVRVSSHIVPLYLSFSENPPQIPHLEAETKKILLSKTSRLRELMRSPACSHESNLILARMYVTHIPYYSSPSARRRTYGRLGICFFLRADREAVAATDLSRFAVDREAHGNGRGTEGTMEKAPAVNRREAASLYPHGTSVALRWASPARIGRIRVWGRPGWHAIENISLCEWRLISQSLDGVVASTRVVSR